VFKSIKDLFKTNSVSQEPDEQQLRLAAATLMFELIRSDGRINTVELIYMKDILKREFLLDEEEVEQLAKRAKETAYEATSLQGFTREICDNWGNAKRTKLLEYLWILAMTDDEVDRHERHLVRKVAGLLYLNDTEIIIAHENAKKQLGIKNNLSH